MARIETVVIPMRIVLNAIACVKLAAPARPSSRKMASGSVGASGRAMNDVAPNSPSEMANANPAPTSMARKMSGKSISRHTLAGGAPNIAPASRSRVRTDRITGTSVRTTNGIATRAWAIGTRIGAVRKSIGLSSATKKPNPMVTADVPSGSMSNTSNQRETAPRW